MNSTMVYWWHPIIILTVTRHSSWSVFSQYKWSAEDQTGVTLDLNEVSTSTGRHSPNLVVRSGVLQPGQSYTFTLNVSQPGRGRWGSASLTIHPNNPPHGGLCELSPESDIRLLETVVTYNCSGNTEWKCFNSELRKSCSLEKESFIHQTEWDLLTSVVFWQGGKMMKAGPLSWFTPSKLHHVIPMARCAPYSLCTGK